MKYGITMFPTEYAVPPDDLGRLIEERGFDSLWFPEHTHIPVERRTPWPGGPNLPREYSHTYDPFVALMAAAAATRGIKVGTGVCLVVERDPIVTAKQVASVDRLSGGRFIFGVGGGWNAEEMENHGTNFNRRFRLLRERMLAMREMWTKDEPEFHGELVNFDKYLINPKPLQDPLPVYMGGDSATTWDRVIEFCDGWMPIARGGMPPPNLRERVPQPRAKAEAAGRDPALPVSIWGAPAREEVVDELKAAGVDRTIFLIPSVPHDEVVGVLDGLTKLMR